MWYFFKNHQWCCFKCSTVSNISERHISMQAQEGVKMFSYWPLISISLLSFNFFLWIIGLYPMVYSNIHCRIMDHGNYGLNITVILYPILYIASSAKIVVLHIVSASKAGITKWVGRNKNPGFVNLLLKLLRCLQIATWTVKNPKSLFDSLTSLHIYNAKFSPFDKQYLFQLQLWLAYRFDRVRKAQGSSVAACTMFRDMVLCKRSHNLYRPFSMLPAVLLHMANMTVFKWRS